MKFAATLAAAFVAFGTIAHADEVIRHPIPNSDFPILQAVEVPGDATTVYLSGVVPAKKADAGDATGIEAYGNMEEQTVSVLTRIEKTLVSLDLSMGDVIKMQAFLVAEDGQPVDFSGFMAGYTQFFATEAQPNVPTRSAMVVDALASPAWLVELEVTAVRP
ncbi:endoribonuclease L-PSP [Salipiger aestuarii]|uniref:Enamine deaminase RidA (YjgF/YER057c/UK114 family) n=1 Tax=Salipiger aestuarii TaxID=568098 RepID=A0A327XKY8_9RHOB|nr:RidA family protein [Salipiger aestuarii]KAA8605532.1 endoribonuclease L-PSP [Salipiger aestuarii]KAB2537899.1 endoribonuclease L-PSP [Salipiger aestuarii]RAK09460.1 enamine deaminase RidA (YjgF/YER057c/UK114 family) [Salipiger aestuarii]